MNSKKALMNGVILFTKIFGTGPLLLLFAVCFHSDYIIDLQLNISF